MLYEVITLGEEPLLPNVPTHLCYDQEALEYTLDHLDELVVKPASESGGYGIATQDGMEAVETFGALEGIHLENTYTGKTAAALLHDLRAGTLDGQCVLYWNTLNSRDLSAETGAIDFHDLPPAFHPYFS